MRFNRVFFSDSERTVCVQGAIFCHTHFRLGAAIARFRIPTHAHARRPPQQPAPTKSHYISCEDIARKKNVSHRTSPQQTSFTSGGSLKDRPANTVRADIRDNTGQRTIQDGINTKISRPAIISLANVGLYKPPPIRQH